ncbi:carbonic anhydrase [Actinacidiphila oryziradicis]|uniref:Carbonic anhydrase n=1 Tax=Actinacidiphila oryziradicis TaxID=2571141 RepID=A0A4U0S0L3_9ACTN|nr:carbonic anhydrase [Actinacidiphila oryziradicis]TKA00591.1 carbonic anhydrase [Actinacidiphila oryziradicis]
MQALIDHARSFHHRCAERHEEFSRLADGQRPQALFITCSDARVIPSLITGAQPGELFELRTAGQAVPRYRVLMPSGEAATIEYAVQVLGVRDIVVCGHSHCGAVRARIDGTPLGHAPAVRDWLRQALQPGLPDCGDPHLAEAVQRHVLTQLDRLRRYPCIRVRAAQGELRLHGWFYDLTTGRVQAHQQRPDTFLPL